MRKTKDLQPLEMLNGQRVSFGKKEAPVSGVSSSLSGPHRPVRERRKMMELFGLEGSMTLPSIRANTEYRGMAFMPDLHQLSGLNIDGDSGWRDLSRDSAAFEYWCRQHGLLTEINDSDYAKPKLAVIG